MNKILITSGLFTLLSIPYGQAQQLQQGIKEFQEYAEQKQIASDIAAKSKAIPFALPDYKSMVSINESGDGIISLPLTTIKGRKLTLPISITYITDGIKVDQNASEVGLGWSISFGSIIRDYGAYEPDYTYLGKETEMINSGTTVSNPPPGNNIETYEYDVNGNI